MANEYDKTKQPSETRYMFGRRMITSSVSEVTRDNLLNVLEKAKSTHDLNRSEIDYLYQYYKGNQPIINRVKEVRPEINNKVVINRANEIVSFKVGYLCGEPIQYVGKDGDDTTTDAITELNNLMFAEDKAAQDEEIVEWQMICGTAFRLVLPDSMGDEDPDEAPFEMYTLDPRDTFVVYSSDIGNKPLMGVKYSVNEDLDGHSVTKYSIYTDKEYFEIEDGLITKQQSHILGMVPIFEYPANNARLGSFETVLPLLDAINKVQSNRLDGVEQTVQAFIKFINCDISESDYQRFTELGAIKVKSVDGQNADVDVVNSELNQQQTQTLTDDLYAQVLSICGMPNRNGGSSTSDTGAAVLLRDGWSLAESRAKDSEHMFKKAEKKMLRLVLRICREIRGLNLRLSDINMKFTRRNYEAIESKSQVLISMLQQPKIHPLLAFESSGLFVDPESAYTLSMEYYDEQMEKWNPQPVPDKEDGSVDNNGDENNVRSNGQVSDKTQAQNQN